VAAPLGWQLGDLGIRHHAVVEAQAGDEREVALGGDADDLGTIALGVDRFGESGARAELYRAMGISADDIARAAEAALLELDSYA